eukprot:23092-Pelagococcus_subviridis.AAC.12
MRGIAGGRTILKRERRVHGVDRVQNALVSDLALGDQADLAADVLRRHYGRVACRARAGMPLRTTR